MGKKLKKSLLLLCLPLLMTVFLSGSGLALAQEQSPTKTKTAEPSPAEAIQAKIFDLQERIRNFAESETKEVARALNTTLEQLRERTEILQETQIYHTQQIQALQRHSTLLEDKEALQKKISTGEILKLEEEPPYSLKYYDDYNALYADSKRSQDMAKLAVTVTEQGLQDARERLAAAATQTRSLRAAAEQANNQQEKLKNQWLFNQAEREEALAAAVLGYQEQILANARIEAELADLKADVARQLSERIRKNLHFDQGDLDTQLAAIDESRTELLTLIEAIRMDFRRAGWEVIKAQRGVEQAKNESDTAAAKTGLTVAEQWQQTYRIKLEQYENILQQMGFRKQLWKQRYDLIKGEIKRSELAKLHAEAVRQRDRLQQTVSLEQERQTNLQLQIGKLEDRLQQEGLRWGAASTLNDQRHALVDLLASTINFLTALNKTSQINLQFIEELDRVLQTFSLSETVTVVSAKLKAWWNAELFVVDNQALTVRKIVISLIILIFGILIAGFFSRFLHKRLLTGLPLSTSATAITSKLIHYTIVLMIIFFAMRIVNIPLAAFAFMGGIIALGVGFGAQKLINNFISGFIIMAEQPVRVGDLIMIDNESGWIEDIGVRSTRVRTYANINILVPNSHFLENNIINWTHNDNVVRGQIVVGVTHGSRTRDVKEAMLNAAAEHGEVRSEPEPYVIFADFGENAMIFELYFWVTVTEHVGILVVSSDLRFMIDRQFQEKGITVAFPQRDVHFDRQGPLRVEIARPGREAGPGKD
jgi:small-conductance mechanosensitive channel